MEMHSNAGKGELKAAPQGEVAQAVKIQDLQRELNTVLSRHQVSCATCLVEIDEAGTVIQTDYRTTPARKIGLMQLCLDQSRERMLETARISVHQQMQEQKKR